MGIVLAPLGKDILRKGGHDDQDADGMLLLEIAQRAPGLSYQDMQAVFVSIMEQYGEDALYAIRNGYVKFEERPAGERPPEGAQ